MKKQEFKTHLLFVGIFSLMVTITAGVKIWSGADSKTAIWQTFTGIRLMEVALFIAFWYQAVKAKKTVAEKPNLTTLHLND